MLTTGLQVQDFVTSVLPSMETLVARRDPTLNLPSPELTRSLEGLDADLFQSRISTDFSSLSIPYSRTVRDAGLDEPPRMVGSIPLPSFDAYANRDAARAEPVEISSTIVSPDIDYAGPAIFESLRMPHSGRLFEAQSAPETNWTVSTAEAEVESDVDVALDRRAKGQEGLAAQIATTSISTTDVAGSSPEQFSIGSLQVLAAGVVELAREKIVASLDQVTQIAEGVRGWAYKTFPGLQEALESNAQIRENGLTARSELESVLPSTVEPTETILQSGAALSGREAFEQYLDGKSKEEALERILDSVVQAKERERQEDRQRDEDQEVYGLDPEERREIEDVVALAGLYLSADELRYFVGLIAADGPGSADPSQVYLMVAERVREVLMERLERATQTSVVHTAQI